MPRRQRGHPGETEPPENTDHEGPAPADLLQMWITGRQPQPAATPEPPQESPPDSGAVDAAPEESAAVEPEPIVPDHPADPVADEATWTDAVDRPWTDTDESTPVQEEPETDPEPAPEPAAGADPVQGWASFGHARTAEDVLERSERNPWLDVLLGETATPPHPPAEPAKPALLRELDHDEEPTEADEPAAYDPDATAVWTLDDFDAYDREDPVAHHDGDDDAEPPDEGTEEVADPGHRDDLVAHAAAVEVMTDLVPGTVAEPRQRVRGLLARMGLHRDAQREEDGTAGLLEAETAASPTESPTESPVESRVDPLPDPVPAAPPVPTPEPGPEPVSGPVPEPLAVAEPEPIPELASIPVSGERPGPEPAPFAAPLTEAPAERIDIGWPEEPDDGWGDVPPPVGGQAAYIARWGSADVWQTDDWEPDKWQSTEPPVAEDPPVLEVAAPPVESTPEAAAPEPVDVVAEPVTPEQPTLFGEQVTEPDLPWDPDSTQDFDFTAIEHVEAAPVDDETVVDVPAREEWYDAAGKLWSSEDGGQTWYTDDGRGWNAETYEDIAPSDAPRSTRPATTGSRSEPSPAPIAEASPEASPEPTTREDDHGPVIPEHVEYKPRASYRPLLGILFVVAAVLAVVAIFWAVSQGGQSSIGIAIGVTGFALAFWWGLISWTPTVVSVDGSILEVARGADGERFDLRDPDLDIDVDDDTASRSWRATITRPDGTELVVPASAVDPDEFTAIVRHYRGQVEREDHPSR